MKKVIKNKKRMKNIMYIVFWTFALLLFMITRTNPSFANEWLIIDDALDKVAEQTVISDPLPEEDGPETSDESLEGDVTEPELNPDKSLVEWDEISQDLKNDEEDDIEDEDDNNDNEQQENLDWEEVDKVENNENKNSDEEWKTEESGKTSEFIQKNEELWEWFTNFNIEKTETTLEIMSDTYNATIQWNSWNMNKFSRNDITIWDYVVMDRNLWATEPWDGTTFAEEYLPSYGYLYQWWNNYWFAPWETITNNSSRVTVALPFIPSMYSSSTFIKQNNTN